MINSICKKTLLACVMLCSISHTIAQTKQNMPASTEQTESDQSTTLTKQQTERLKAIVKDIDGLFQQTLNLYQKLSTLLEEIAIMVDNNVIKTENKAALIGQIKNIRQLVDQIRRDAPLNVEPHHIYILTSLHTCLLEHIDAAVKKGFKELPDFDIKNFLSTRHIPTELTLELLQENITSSQEQIKKVHENATKIGLTWYNKFFRKMSDLDYKYRVLTVGSKLAVTGAMWGTYFAFLYNTWNVAQGQESNWFGTEAHSETIKKGEDGLLGTINNTMLVVGLGHAPLLATFLQFTKTLWTAEYYIAKEITQKLYARISGSLKGGIDKVQAEKEEQERYGDITFDDVVGLEYAKEVLMDLINYIEDPERFDLVKIAPEKGYLLAGPSRTGKSWLAKALQGEIKKVLERKGLSHDEFAFYAINAETIIQKGMAYLHHLAENAAPCILFIDEIDLLGLQRAGGSLQLLSEFLTCMSGINKSSRKQVIILAATNKPENLDEALRKRGRFGKIINFNYPSCAERKEHITKKLEALAIDITNFDLELIIQETEGRTFEDLNAMIATALKKAKMIGSPLTQGLLNEALNEEVRNIITKDNINATELELDILSSQIAGRALTHMLLGCLRSLNCATIRPISIHIAEQTVFERLNKKEGNADSTIVQNAIQYGAIFTNYSFDSIKLETREELFKQCKVLLAGNIVESMLLGACGHTYRPEDRQKAFDIIKKIVFAGINVSDLPRKHQEQYFAESFALLTQLEREVETLLAPHKLTLKAIADELKKHLTLSETQIKAIMEESSINIPVVAAT